MRAGYRALLEPLGYMSASLQAHTHQVHLVDERRLDRQRASPTIVAVLSTTDGELVCRAAAAGARGLVHRDDPIEELARAIECVGAGSFWVSAAFSDAVHELLVASSVRRAVTPELEELSPRQREVLELLVAGTSTAAIAGELGIARGTVKLHISDVLRKLGVPTRAAAVAAVLGLGGA